MEPFADRRQDMCTTADVQKRSLLSELASLPRRNARDAKSEQY